MPIYFFEPKTNEQVQAAAKSGDLETFSQLVSDPLVRADYWDFVLSKQYAYWSLSCKDHLSLQVSLPERIGYIINSKKAIATVCGAMAALGLMCAPVDGFSAGFVNVLALSTFILSFSYCMNCLTEYFPGPKPPQQLQPAR